MRSKLSKIVLAAFAVNSALSMAFADIPKNCVEELTNLSKLSQTNGFDIQAFINNLPPAVAKAKLQAKAPLGQPKDSDIMDLGMTFGCLKDLPESPSEIASLFSEINQVEAQPQYVQPQVQYVYVYVPQPDQPNQQKKYQKNQRLIEEEDDEDEDNDERQEIYWNIQNLINDGLKKNRKEIQRKSLSLPYNDVQDLYNKNKKNARGCAALSGTVGFGIGSYIQGNKAFGITQTLLDGLGGSLIIFANNNAVFGRYTMVISRIAGLIVPFIYQQSYNKTLAEALNNNYFHFTYSYSIDPLIVPKDEAPAVGLAFNLRY